MIEKIISKSRLWLLSVLAVFSNSVMAALPTPAAPSRAPADGNYIQLLQGYAYDALIFGGLLLAAIGFYVVASQVIGVYKEIGTGRKSWGDMGWHALTGVLLLVFIVYLMTEASTIIFAA